MAAPCSITFSASQETVIPLDTDLAEITLFLTARQAAALEEAARQFGLTAAQMTRCLIEEFLHGQQGRRRHGEV